MRRILLKRKYGPAANIMQRFGKGRLHSRAFTPCEYQHAQIFFGYHISFTLAVESLLLYILYKSKKPFGIIDLAKTFCMRNKTEFYFFSF